MVNCQLRRPYNSLAGLTGDWILSLVVAALTLSLSPLELSAQDEPHPPLPPPGTQAKPALSLEERADIFMARKSYADAVDYYHRALKESNFSKASLWNKLGIAYQQESSHSAARKAYKQAIRQKADFAEAYNNIGTTYYLENHYKKSVKYYLRAIRLDPNSGSFRLNLGTAYYHMKKTKEAVDEYRSALELDPNILTDHASLGTVVQARGADAEFYFYLAKVFASLDRPEDSVRYLRRAFEDGLKTKGRLEQDPDFQKISQYPAYVELVKKPPVGIKD